MASVVIGTGPTGLLRLAGLLCLVALLGCRRGVDGRETVVIKGHAFHLEPAIDDASRTMGLMHRESIPEDGGMLFVFPDAQRRGFWMGNCLIDIDIIYLDSRGRITALHRMKAEAPQGMLVGFGLNQSLVPLDQSLFAGDFDDRPVLVIAYDVHTALLNRAGLEALEISADTPNPNDGVIEKHPETGEPTGLLLDSALHDVMARIGNPGLVFQV